MTKKTRRVIFLVLLALFLIISPIAVIYCLGWRFDWQSKKIIQPGMFYFKVWPKGAQIYVNNELKGKTDFFFDSVLIENLIPNNYRIEAKKDGYYTWEKTLEIFKRQVTEARNITLIPEKPEISILSENVDDFFFSPDNKNIIIKEIDNASTETWSLKLFDLTKKIKSHLISQKDLKLISPDLVDISFSSDSKKALITAAAKEKLYYFVLDIEKAQLTSFNFLGVDTEKVFFDPKDPKKILVLANQEIKEADPDKKELSPALIKNVISFNISGENIYYLDSEGFIFKTSDWTTDNKERINIIPFEIKQETKYELFAENDKIFLKEDATLYIFNEEKMLFEKLLDPIENFVFLNNKIAYFNQNEIWVMFLGKKYDQPTKEASDKVFITRFSENIGNVFWYTDNYLIFNVQDKIKVAEIDDRDKINIVDLAEYKDPKIYFANRKLYILSEQKLYSSAELTP